MKKINPVRNYSEGVLNAVRNNPARQDASGTLRQGISNGINIAVLGDGGWGTTLAILLFKKGFGVAVWGAFTDYAELVDKERINEKFLPGIKIPKGIEITPDLKRALKDRGLIILAVPSQHMRRILQKVKSCGFSKDAIFLNAAKGIEVGSLKRMSQIVHEELGSAVKAAVLSGPTIAYEVARGIPTVAVVASFDQRLRKYLQNIFISERFRVYTSADVIGVELGGALKILSLLPAASPTD